MLIIFSGLPGCGKSTLAAHLAHNLGATYLRIDTIEKVLKTRENPQVGQIGYEIAQDQALENLRLGNPVVADCVNPVPESRSAWLRIAELAECESRTIEVVCSDTKEHQERVEARFASTPGNTVPNWSQVESRRYEPWSDAHLLFDTANETQDQSRKRFLAEFRSMDST